MPAPVAVYPSMMVLTPPTLAALIPEQPRAVRLARTLLGAGRMPHAVLLDGARSSSLLAFGKAMVAAACCPHSIGRAPDACGQCAACLQVCHGSHADLLELDAKKQRVGVDEVRALAKRLALTSQNTRLKVILIIGACSLGPAAQNALLKVLEEPAGATLFVLLAHRPKALLPTVRSRLARIHLVTPAPQLIHDVLSAAGIDENLIDFLGPRIGCDVAAAKALCDEDLASIVEHIRQALALGIRPHELTGLVTALTQDKGCFELVQDTLEVILHDALALRAGADKTLGARACARAAWVESRTETLTHAADALRDLRRRQTMNPNRNLALGGLFNLLHQRESFV